jgi:hypothetical protein
MKRAVALVVSLTLVAACAETREADEPAPTTTTAAPATSTTAISSTPPTTAAPEPPPADLPPHTASALIELFDPVARPLGFRVTRGALVDMASYRTSPDGRHLALYVAPIEDLTAAEHAEAFVPLAVAFLPAVFERWPGLESFDICQEPHDWPGGGTPPAVTILDLDRATAQAIAWETVDLATLVELAGLEQNLTVSASPEVAASDPWTAAGGG